MKTGFLGKIGHLLQKKGNLERRLRVDLRTRVDKQLATVAKG